MHGKAAADRLIIDTGNLTGKHIISNLSLFSRIDRDAPGIPIMVANDQIEHSRGSGECHDLTVIGPDHQPFADARDRSGTVGTGSTIGFRGYPILYCIRI